MKVGLAKSLEQVLSCIEHVDHTLTILESWGHGVIIC